MSNVQKRSSQQAELHSKLWTMANDLRGNMNAEEFKNYILGVLFYRFLSDKLEKEINSMLEIDGLTYEEAWEDEEYREDIKEEVLEDLGYIIEPKYLFSNMIELIKNNEFDVEVLATALTLFNESIMGTKNQEAFENLFEDLDVNSSKLGRTVRERSLLIGKILITISTIDISHDDAEIDVLGDAYEYLIGQFAANSGRKAGEFYTESQCAKLMAKIATHDRNRIESVFDCACGSGSLLLQVNKEVEVAHIYGQEKNSTTYNLARMNMLLHGRNYQNFHIKNCDTLTDPYFRDILFDVQVLNPPYSLKNWQDNPAILLEDERFSAYGKLAPNSKADFAFVQHTIHHMKDDGIGVVLLPHGVLFRGAAEKTIRKHIIEKQNVLDAVIGLPPKLFYATDIPVVILVLKKNRENTDNILFIDASKYFEPGKNQNRLREEDIDRIMSAYIERRDIDKFAHVASMEEIKENDYNLNIPRYADTFEKEEPIDIEAVFEDINTNNENLMKIDKELMNYFKELGL